MDVRQAMQLRRVVTEDERIVIETTGARYVVHKMAEHGEIECWQLLNGERLLARLRLSVPLADLTVEGQDAEKCVLNTVPFVRSCAFVRLQINRDSLLDISSTVPLTVSADSAVPPEYFATRNGHLIGIDRTGGIGLYSPRGLSDAGTCQCTGQGWQASFELARNGRFLVSVFPPRPFDAEQYYGTNIMHHGTIGPWVVPPFPTADMLEAGSRQANVLVLHEGLWQGKLTRAGKQIESVADIYADAAYASYDFPPVDDDELRRTVDTAHKLGMKVIPYMSPFYSSAKGLDFQEKARHALRVYGLDGLYFDGVSFDVLESYATIRAAREIVGDGMLYVHCTSDPIGRNVFCPFIDTYADAILRAEHGTALSEPALRYTISGRNVSNAVGYLCYYDYPYGALRDVIAAALELKFKFYLGSPRTEREELLVDEYFPRLRAERAACGLRDKVRTQ